MIMLRHEHYHSPVSVEPTTVYLYVTVCLILEKCTLVEAPSNHDFSCLASAWILRNKLANLSELQATVFQTLHKEDDNIVFFEIYGNVFRQKKSGSNVNEGRVCRGDLPIEEHTCVAWHRCR